MRVPLFGRVPGRLLLAQLCNTLPALCLLLLTTTTADAEYLNDLNVLPPASTLDSPSTRSYSPSLPYRTYEVIPRLRPTEAIINADYQARAAVFVDSTRLASFAGGAFVPSAIPVAGQEFFGTGTRANLQGSGSAVRLSAYSSPSSTTRASVHTDLVVDNATFSADTSGESIGFAVRRVVAKYKGFTIGLSESAFSDPAAVPETIDLAGPSARVTVFDAGITQGQGRLSYDFFSEGEGGFKVIGSIEQAIAEISFAADTESSFSHIPDFIVAPQYVVGDTIDGKFIERWHLQLASVYRSLAFETPAAGEESEFGWGTALSGAYRFSCNAALEEFDRFVFSVAYGEGISHYLADLNAAPDTGDATVNTGGIFEALPVLAWYCGYTHNWTDTLRSTVTFSQIDLQSVTPRTPSDSPYRKGSYVAVNLMKHVVVEKPAKPKPEQKNLFLGTEYLYGHKETLDGSTGDAHRLMLVMAISK